MRVLHVIPSMAPSYGGPTNALRGLSKALNTRGIYSEVLTTDLGFKKEDSIAYERLVNLNNVNVRFFPRILSAHMPRDFALSPRLARWLRSHVRNYNIVNIHGFFNYPNTVAARIAHNAGVAYIVRTCGMLDPWSLQQSRLEKMTFIKLFGNSILRDAAAISFTTQEEAKKAYKVTSQTNNFIIPLGVNAFEDLTENMTAFPLPSDKKIILFLSRIDPKKGIELLLLALARLKNVRSDFLAVIAGSGSTPYETKIRSLVKATGLTEVVRFVGFVEGERKHQLLKKATCFVLPSYQENFGISVAEAMAAGCPVIISNQVNIHAEVSAARAGKVIHCDSEDLFLTINKLIDDEATLQQMAANGRELVRRKYSWDLIVQETISMYQHCLQQHTRQFSQKSLVHSL